MSLLPESGDRWWKKAVFCSSAFFKRASLMRAEFDLRDRGRSCRRSGMQTKSGRREPARSVSGNVAGNRRIDRPLRYGFGGADGELDCGCGSGAGGGAGGSSDFAARRAPKPAARFIAAMCGSSSAFSL